MESKQITLEELYSKLKHLERVLQQKGVINRLELSENKELVSDWPEQAMFLADEALLGKDWLSKEDEEAWGDL
ncbi:MAG TPA: hypothetical protein VJK51_01765 [Candidatus Nanoarchaeia archaeon]|nr:hypothetical protein [Candidatus Nanoarchaeia archaeon]